MTKKLLIIGIIIGAILAVAQTNYARVVEVENRFSLPADFQVGDCIPKSGPGPHTMECRTCKSIIETSEGKLCSRIYTEERVGFPVYEVNYYSQSDRVDNSSLWILNSIILIVSVPAILIGGYWLVNKAVDIKNTKLKKK